MRAYNVAFEYKKEYLELAENEEKRGKINAFSNGFYSRKNFKELCLLKDHLLLGIRQMQPEMIKEVLKSHENCYGDLPNTFVEYCEVPLSFSLLLLPFPFFRTFFSFVLISLRLV